MIEDDPPCPWCGQPAALLCDGVLGRNPLWPEKLTLEAIDAGTVRWWTCDLPVCRCCARHVTTMFFCGTKSDAITIDLCPLHRDGPSVGCGLLQHLPILSSHEADVVRRRNAMRVGVGR